MKESFLELRSKVDEYEAIIDSMEQEYKDKCNDHQTKQRLHQLKRNMKK